MKVVAYSWWRAHARLSNCFHGLHVWCKPPCPRAECRLPRLTAGSFRLFYFIYIFAVAGDKNGSGQQAHLPFKTGGVADLSSRGPQSRRGDLYIADDDVDIRYGDSRLRADHVEYNEKTSEAFARGHVQFDFENQHVEADEAHYNVKTGHGVFHNVRGTVKIERRPNPNVLLSDNPLYFEARDVERFAKDVYVIDQAWITICDAEHPTWQFYAPHARVQLEKTVAMVNANFRLFRVPLIWLPYATAPAGTKSAGVWISDPGYRRQFAEGVYGRRCFLLGSQAVVRRHAGSAIHEFTRSGGTRHSARQAI